jgi:hypothetical protein
MTGTVTARDLTCLRVAGLGIRVRVADGVPLAAGPEHEPFRVDEVAAPDLVLTFADGEARGWFPRGDLRFNAHDALRFYADPTTPGGLVVDVACGRRARCEARLSPEREQAEIRIAPWLPDRTLLTLPRAYEVACATRFARRGALLVHALGLSLPGLGGVLLPASTGSGKSTLGALHPAAAVLSDERVGLRLGPGADSPRTRGDGGMATIHGTPLRATGRRVQAIGAPLRALAFLGPHGGADSATGADPATIANAACGLRPLRPAEAFRRLAFHAFPPFWDLPGLERALDVARAVATSVPAFELRFVPGPAVPEQLHEALCRLL